MTSVKVRARGHGQERKWSFILLNLIVWLLPWVTPSEIDLFFRNPFFLAKLATEAYC